jgi:hypothetical protein
LDPNPHFTEKLELDPHSSEKLDPDLLVFKVIRIRNPAPALSPPATVSWERRLCGFPFILLLVFFPVFWIRIVCFLAFWILQQAKK